jgi:peptidoglycan pentaglycine glycine transferase (the first glycine)
MEVRIITDRVQWNGFLTQKRDGHLLQSYEWGELSSSLGNGVVRLGAFEREKLVGTMMFTIADVPRPNLFAIPRLKWLYCCRGPNLQQKSKQVLNALLEQAHTVARQEKAIILRLEPNITEEEDKDEGWSRSFQQLGFSINPISIHGRRSWVLDIRPDLEELFHHFRKKWRQNIRQAEKRGVIVRTGQSEVDFDAYYQLLRSTSAQQHFFLHPKSYYQQMFRTFVDTGNGVLFVAEHNQHIVGVNMLIRFGERCWDMYSASRDKRLGLNESYLLQYRCFEWAKAQGCTHFDFRVIPEVLDPNEEMWGIYEFKQGFGGGSALHIQTQDYIYRPLSYKAWHLIVKHRRAKRKMDYQRRIKGVVKLIND